MILIFWDNLFIGTYSSNIYEYAPASCYAMLMDFGALTKFCCFRV